MSQELIAIIGFGITVLGHGVWFSRTIGARMDSLENDVRDGFGQVSDDFASQSESIMTLRERMAHLEGLLEGLREAIAGRKAE